LHKFNACLQQGLKDSLCAGWPAPPLWVPLHQTEKHGKCTMESRGDDLLELCPYRK
jgi:hypothetical protein